MNRVCSRCGEEKPLNQFRIDRRKPSGRGSICKPCNSAVVKRRYTEYRDDTGQNYRDRYRTEVVCPSCGARRSVQTWRTKRSAFTGFCKRCQAITSCGGLMVKDRPADWRSGGLFRIPASLRYYIYQRDGWICQLCGELVAPELVGTRDLRRPTLDHIIPQSRTAEPDHSADNLRLAHWWCNMKRGADRFNPVLIGVIASQNP